MNPPFLIALLASALACAVPAVTMAQARPAAAPAASAASAPGAQTELENAGKMTAHAWLALLDRRDWGTAWDSSGNVFRQSVPLAGWMDAVPKVRQPFGALVEREAIEAIYKTTLPGRPAGQYVSVMFVSKFEKQTVQEIVTTMREPDGRFRVIGYSPTPR